MPSLRRLSPDTEHYFFGYYGINPWSPDGRYHLALCVDDDSKPPALHSSAKLGLIDAANQSFSTLTETYGWNLQQGCMAHWARSNKTTCISYNDLEDGHCVTKLIALDGTQVNSFPSGLCALATDGHHAYGLDFARMYHCRSVVGYTNLDSDIDPCPDDNGIWAFNLNTKQHQLLLSIAEVFDKSSASIAQGARCWLNHVLPNPSNTALMFVARYQDGEHFRTSLWSINSDGSSLCEEIPFGAHVSHFCWRDDDTLVVSTTHNQAKHMRFMAIKRGSSTCTPYGGDALMGDSHLCFAPNRQLAVGDRYPDKQGNADLFLFNPNDNTATALGSFLHPQLYRGDIRCDLHPRWSSDSKHISFDSIHEGKRAIYLIEL